MNGLFVIGNGLSPGVTKEPTHLALRLGRALCKIVVFVQVGRVRVCGRDNLPPGAVLVCSNHPHYADVFLLPLAVGRWLTYMAHREIFRFGLGFLRRGVERLGGFPNGDGTPKGVLRACASAVEALRRGRSVAVFPEGLTTFRQTMEEVSRGCIRILRNATDLGTSTVIVPIHIRYGRYPGSWIKHYSYPVKYLLMLIGFAWYRRGATVTLGAPISYSEFPANEKIAVRMLADRITLLDPEHAG